MPCQHLAGPRMEEVQWIAGLRPDRDVHGRGFKPVLQRVLPQLFSSSTLLPGETGIPGGKSGWKANLLRMPSLPTWSAAVATLGRATGSPAQPPSCLPTSRSTTSSPQLLFEFAPPPHCPTRSPAPPPLPPSLPHSFQTANPPLLQPHSLFQSLTPISVTITSRCLQSLHQALYKWVRCRTAHLHCPPRPPPTAARAASTPRCSSPLLPMLPTHLLLP